jgi:hypothetical protein
MSNSMLDLSLEELTKISRSVPSLAPRANAALVAKKDSVATTFLPEHAPFPAAALSLALNALVTMGHDLSMVTITGFTTDRYAMAGRIWFYDHSEGVEASLWCDEQGRISTP